jgi:hypothetical protein
VSGCNLRKRELTRMSPLPNVTMHHLSKADEMFLVNVLFRPGN